MSRIEERSAAVPVVPQQGSWDLPRKIRQLVKDLIDAGFELLPGGVKGPHRKFTHPDYRRAVTLSGQDGDDAKKYQEKQVKQAIEEANG